jgi:hypothetical protein
MRPFTSQRSPATLTHRTSSLPPHATPRPRGPRRKRRASFERTRDPAVATPPTPPSRPAATRWHGCGETNAGSIPAADALLPQRGRLVADGPLPQGGQQRRPLKIHQQRRIRCHRDPHIACTAGQMSEIVGEQPLEVAADVDPAGPHHLHPRAVRVVGARHDLDVGGAAPSHHESLIRRPNASPILMPLSASKANSSRSRRLPTHSPVAVSNPAQPSRIAWISLGINNGGRPRRRLFRTRTNDDAPDGERASRCANSPRAGARCGAHASTARRP